MSGIDEKIRIAQSAEGEELWKVIRLQHPDIMFNAVLNRNLTEEMAFFVARSRNASQETIGVIAGDRRFGDSYKIKRAVCGNPKSPQRVALSLLKHLRIFDLADLTRNQHIPLLLRQKVEFMLEEKVHALPAGIKTALARRVCGKVVIKIMEKSDRRVIDACLQGPMLTEEHIYRLVNRKSTKPVLIRAIAEHPKWSLRYTIKFALIRNFHTPMVCVDSFIGTMKTSDLRYLHEDAKLPTATRPFIFRELRRRNESPEASEEETYVISEDESEDADVNIDDDFQPSG
jgi:hypothetical protein